MRHLLISPFIALALVLSVRLLIRSLKVASLTNDEAPLRLAKESAQSPEYVTMSSKMVVLCKLWQSHNLSQLLNDCKPRPVPQKPLKVPWRYGEEQAENSPLSSPEKWVILLEVNTGYLDFFQNWIAHFSLLKLDINVLVIAGDDIVEATIAKEVIPKYPKKFTVKRSDVLFDSAQLNYDTPAYRKMVSARAIHILSKLETGINVIYSDVDTVWRSNPLPYLAATNKADMIIEVDTDEAYGFTPYYCTGFMTIVSNIRTVQLMKDWQRALVRPQLNQPVFNKLLHEQSNVRHQPLPKTKFPSGALYFHQFSDEERENAVIVHGNYMIGHAPRKKSFQKHNLWMINETITSLSPSQLVHANISNERVFVANVSHHVGHSLQEEKKAIFAIIAATRSTSDWNHILDTPLQKHLIQSIAQSVKARELLDWDIHLYVAVDDDDIFWVHKNNMQELWIPSWLTLTFGIFPRVPNHIPFNDIARVAYRHGAEYFCRVNDDSDFVTAGWITLGMNALRNFDPPNLGVIGPTCPDGNTAILTHDMVHRTHMEVFHQNYYPPEFHNWYLDDWITFQYQEETIGVSLYMKLKEWTVRHHRSEKRYQHNDKDAKLLPNALDNGRQEILKYLQKNFAFHPTTLAVESIQRKANVPIQ